MQIKLIKENGMTWHLVYDYDELFFYQSFEWATCETVVLFFLSLHTGMILAHRSRAQQGLSSPSLTVCLPLVKQFRLHKNVTKIKYW